MLDIILFSIPLSSPPLSESLILPAVCKGIKLGLTLRDEHRVRMFENRVLRRIYGPERKEVAGGWRRLHNEELHNLYTSPNIIRTIKLMRILLV
jgi:hypothetical protein